jgi:Cellulase (glycosyl hydrolase family 5)
MVLAALALVAGGVAAGALLRDADGDSTAPPPSDTRLPALAAPAIPPVATRTEPLLVGFMDDASLRWIPSRGRMLDRAQATGARVIRALVSWHVIAPRRPAQGAAPFEASRVHDLDELVAGARARGMEVMLTIWGTPAWAGGKPGPNRAPTDLDAFREFARGIAARYPSVRRYSVWNEPNTQLFLSPQFDRAGRSVAPRAYATMFRAAYEGIKAANPDALVAIGETGSHGADVPRGGGQDRHSPARFAQLLSRQQPRLEFDAWAHHPYPIRSSAPPDKPSVWPHVVTLTSLPRFVEALDRWFAQENTPLWVTEFAYEAAPAEPAGVSEDVQAEYAARSLALAAEVPQVTLFIWFPFADHESNRWQSGLLDADGEPRSAYERFTEAVHELR